MGTIGHASSSDGTAEGEMLGAGTASVAPNAIGSIFTKRWATGMDDASCTLDSALPMVVSACQTGSSE
jgi:hypothetical protein